MIFLSEASFEKALPELSCDMTLRDKPNSKNQRNRLTPCYQVLKTGLQS